MVRAKFRVLSVAEHFAYRDAAEKIHTTTEVRLVPVQNKGSDENASFWKDTPSGELRMSITNPAAAIQFKPGRVYYLDFTDAPE